MLCASFEHEYSLGILTYLKSIQEELAYLKSIQEELRILTYLKSNQEELAMITLELELGIENDYIEGKLETFRYSVVRRNDTRWDGTHLMMERLLRLTDPMNTFFNTQTKYSRNSGCIYSNTERINSKKENLVPCIRLMVEILGQQMKNRNEGGI